MSVTVTLQIAQKIEIIFFQYSTVTQISKEVTHVVEKWVKFQPTSTLGHFHPMNINKISANVHVRSILIH